MTDKELKDIFQTIKNERRGGAPHEVWVERNRGILLMQVKNTTDVTAKPKLGETMRHLFSIFFPTEGFAMAARAAGVFLLVLGTVFGGGLVSAQVYQVATPGAFAYKVKLAVERAQLFLAPNEEYRASLHTEFADHRLDEAAKLAEQGPDMQAFVPGVLASFDAEVGALSASLDARRSSDPDGVAEAAKLTERKMAVYQNILRKAGSLLPPALQPRIAVSRDLVDGLTIKAIAVIVEKHLAGSSAAPRAVVVNKFEERIKQAEAKIESAPPTTDEKKTVRTAKAKAAIAEAKVLIQEEKYQAALTKIEEVAELTKEVDDTAAPEGGAPADGAVTPPAPETVSTPNTSTTNEGAPPAPVSGTPPAEPPPAPPPAP
ncbi:MAG TPA: DUF5667 domain-containing protein [Candidatus Binatia bacterium]|nr:DUF5667 domain-containing protein [Candidatus Binatia bacterium]